MATLYDANGEPVEIDDSLLGQQGGDDRGPQTNAEFAALRRANTETRREKEARETMEKKYAFLRAGIDPDAKEGIAPYFIEGYKGDLDPEKIKEAAVAAGIIQPPAATPEQIAAQEAQQQALGAQQRISDAAGSAMAAPTGDDAQKMALTEAYRKGGMEGLEGALGALGIPRSTN
jgi:hypothetical protein